MDKVESCLMETTDVAALSSHCSWFKHSVILIIPAASVVQSVMIVLMVIHLLLIKIGDCSVYTITTSKRRAISIQARSTHLCSSTFAPRCAACTYPICPDEVRHSPRWFTGTEAMIESLRAQMKRSVLSRWRRTIMLIVIGVKWDHAQINGWRQSVWFRIVNRVWVMNRRVLALVAAVRYRMAHCSAIAADVNVIIIREENESIKEVAFIWSAR